ncbi:MAG: ABC transporter substrate-binding protein [Rectinemataceae bacterium]
MDSKKRLIILVSAIAAAVVLALVLVLLLWKPAPTGIAVGVAELPDSLNPILSQNVIGGKVDEILFDGLVNYEADPNGAVTTVLGLASSIEQDRATKKTYTAKLKEVKFHDGKELEAEDVAFSYRCYVDAANNSPQRDYLSSFIEGVKVVDKSTLEIEFREPIPEFRAFSVLSFKIIPSTYAGKKLSTDLRSGQAERAFATKPVGTGPFAFQSWEVGKWVTFKANESYFRKRPEAKGIVLRRVVDPALRFNEYKKGRLNLILDTTPLDRSIYEKIQGTDVISYYPYAFYMAAINMRSAALSDADARRSLSLAVDRAALVPGVTDRGESVVVNTGPFPSNIFSRALKEYDLAPLPDPYPRDAQKAKSLAESGGLSRRSLAIVYPDSMGDFGQKVAEGLVAQFGSIGVKAEARRTGDQVFKRLVYVDKKFDIALVLAEGFDNFYSGLIDWYRSNGKLNIFGTEDVQLDKNLDLWSASVSLTDWLKPTEAIHKRISELVPAVYLFTLEKDVFARGLEAVTILSDNSFLSVEDWKLK